MFMLNNYTTESFIGFGTAQKVTSSSSVTVEAGKIYKLGVNIKTVNLYGANSSAEYANIRLTNSIGGNSQAEYRIGKINTQGEWKNYSVYIALKPYHYEILPFLHIFHNTLPQNRIQHHLLSYFFFCCKLGGKPKTMLFEKNRDYLLPILLVAQMYFFSAQKA